MMSKVKTWFKQGDRIDENTALVIMMTKSMTTLGVTCLFDNAKQVDQHSWQHWTKWPTWWQRWENCDIPVDSSEKDVPSDDESKATYRMTTLEHWARRRPDWIPPLIWATWIEFSSPTTSICLSPTSDAHQQSSKSSQRLFVCNYARLRSNPTTKSTRICLYF